MYRINNYLYPVLDYIGCPVIFEHPDFSRIFEIYKRNECSAEEWESLKELGGIDDVPGKAAILSLRKDAALERMPLFSVGKKDRQKWGIYPIMSTYTMLSYMWAMQINRQWPEIVPGYLWDQAYDYDAKGEYDRWLEEKAKNGCVASGILIRPKEEVTEMFVISYKEDFQMEMSVILGKGQILSSHVNFCGLISRLLELPQKELKTIANSRRCSIEEAFFQEDMYNILKYLFYKEHFMLTPTSIGRGNVLTLPDGQYNMFSDTRCDVYGVALT